MWAGIKHAINSTLGTSKFKPLDQMLIDELAYEATASQNVLKSIVNDTLTTSNKSRSIECGFSGTVTIQLRISGSSGYQYTSYPIVSVTKNNVSVLTIDGTGGILNTGYIIRTANVDLQRGDVLKIEYRISQDSGQSETLTADVLGDLHLTKLFKEVV